MDKEILALVENKIWELVELPEKAHWMQVGIQGKIDTLW